MKKITYSDHTDQNTEFKTLLTQLIASFKIIPKIIRINTKENNWMALLPMTSSKIFQQATSEHLIRTQTLTLNQSFILRAKMAKFRELRYVTML